MDLYSFIYFHRLELNIDRIIKCLSSEINVMKTLHHKNVMRLEELIIDGDIIYLVLEFCDGGDIASYMKQIHNRTSEYSGMSEVTTQFFAKQIMLGLQHMHSYGIIHRDLKPHNLLLTTQPPISDNGIWNSVVVKIADFGFAKKLEQTQLTGTICGSPLYMAPEVLNSRKYSDNTDLWSFGVILYEMMYGVTPFIATSVIELCKIYQTQREIQLPQYVKISDDCIHLLKSLLVIEPNKRISWEKFFNHPWFNNELSYTECNKISLDAQLINVDLNLLNSFEIIDECENHKIMKASNIKSDIKGELMEWKYRISALVKYGNISMNLHYYDEAKKFFEHAICIINILIDTTIENIGTEIKNDEKAISEIALIIMQLKEFLKVCSEDASYCHKKGNLLVIGKPTEKLIFDRAISLGNQGNVNDEISNDKQAIEQYSDGIRLFETILQTSNDSVAKIVREHIEKYKGAINRIITK